MKLGRHIIWTGVLGAIYGTAALAVEGRLIQWVGDLNILAWITVGLIGINLAAFLIYAVFQKEKNLVFLLLSVVVNIFLFFILHQQLFDLSPDDHYAGTAAPTLTHWLMFIASQLVNALDLPDILSAFDMIDLSPIAAKSVAASAAVGVLSAIVGGLVFMALLKWTAGRLSDVDELPAPIKWGGLGFLLATACLMAVFGWLDNWPSISMAVWPLENLAAVVDFPDLLSIFDLKFDNPKPGSLITIMAAVFRLAALGCFIVIGARLLQRLSGDDKPDIDNLASVFLSADHPLEDRVGAIQTLSQYGAFAESAIPHLIKALTDDAPKIREAAAETLGIIDPEWPQHEAVANVIPDLIKSLKSKDKGTRIAAAGVVGAIGAPAESAVDRLIAGLNDSDAEVRIAMIEALKEMGPAAETAAEPLMDRLTDADENIREAAAETLVMIGEPAIPVLVKTLISDDTALRRKAVATLDAIDADWPQSDKAKEALGHFIETLKNGFGEARIAAIEALGQLGPGARDALPDLVPELIDGDKDVQNATIKTLKRIEPKWVQSQEAKKAAPDLLKALADSDKNVQATAAKVLEKIDPQWPGKPYAVEAVPHFVSALDHGLETVRLAGANVLGHIGPPAKDAVPKLILKLSDYDANVRAAASAALNKINPAWRKDPSVVESVPALVEDLASDDWRKRSSAAGALGEIGPDAAGEAIPSLVEHLADGDKNVRLAVRAALKKIDPRWPLTKAARSRIPELMKSLGESQWSIRAAAVEALGIFGSSAAKITAPRLAKVMNTDSIPDVRAIAKKTLAKVDPEGKFH